MKKKKFLGVTMSASRIRTVLQLWFHGKNQSQIARDAQVSRSSVQDYVHRVTAIGLTWLECQLLDDKDLVEKLGKQGGHKRALPVELDYAKILSELGRKGVTLRLLHQEVVVAKGVRCSYPTFCRRIQEHQNTTGVVLRQHYAPGEYCMVDYAGLTVPIWNAQRTEVVSHAQVFVSVLGASGLIFVEATESQEVKHFIGSHVRCFEFYGGVPLILIPDNLKSAVIKSDRYEPELNRAYEEFGAHYGVTVLPARVRKPRDKGKVERAVLEVERGILAPLRDHKFTSVLELNVAMKPPADALNHRQMREKGASRRELFERFEKEVLKPLPATRYEAVTFKLARVNIDYHVEFKKHYYSVPYQYNRQEVWIRVSEHQVAVYLHGKSIAIHPRSRAEYRFSTVTEHMPANHQAMRSRTASVFLDWAASIGPESRKLVDRALTLGAHEQQAFRSILGMQRLVKSYSPAAFEAAAKEANGACLASCKRLRGIIARQYAEQLSVSGKQTPIILHANLRDPKDYH